MSVPGATVRLLALVEEIAGGIVVQPNPNEPQRQMSILRPMWMIVQKSVGPYGKISRELMVQHQQVYAKAERWMSILEALYPLGENEVQVIGP